MTTTESTSDATYVLGHPSGEEQRLQRLGQLQYASTRPLLTRAGVVPGVRGLAVRRGGSVGVREGGGGRSEGVEGMVALSVRVRQAGNWIVGGFRQAGAEMQIGFKFPHMFLEAGLPLPHMSLDGIVGTEADWVGYDFLTDVLRDILPKLYEYSIVKGQLDAASYVARLREEIRPQHALFPLFFLAGALTQKG